MRIVATGVPGEVAAGALGISRETYYRWRRHGQRQKDGPHRHFYDATEKAFDEWMVNTAARAHVNGRGQWVFDMTMLERRGRRWYGRPAPVEALPSDQSADNAAAFDASKLTAAQRDKLRTEIDRVMNAARRAMTIDGVSKREKE